MLIAPDWRDRSTDAQLEAHDERPARSSSKRAGAAPALISGESFAGLTSITEGCSQTSPHQFAAARREVRETGDPA